MTATLFFGRTTEDWERLEAACLQFLVERAQLKRTTTYTELNTVLAQRTEPPGFDFNEQAGRVAMGTLLGRVVDRAISTYTDFPKLMISCLVVYLNDNDTGSGFYQLARQKRLLQPGQSPFDFWLLQVDGVHSYFAKPHTS